MVRNFYIIPGWEDDCNDESYRKLANIAERKGYNVVCKQINWKLPLTQQKFPIPEDSIIFGFSLGAIMALLLAQDYPCDHLILASMTLHNSFKQGKDREALIELTGQQFVDDIADNLKPHQAKK